MNKFNFLLLLLFPVVISGCYQTRFISESYIKNKVEQRKVNDFNTIKIYKIYANESLNAETYLEFTGYKTSSEKGLVISSDKYYKARKRNKKDPFVSYVVSNIELSVSDCEKILENYKTLKDKLQPEYPRRNEEVYFDYNVTKDFFISYRKSFIKPMIDYINLWINGEKYMIKTEIFITQIEKFIAY